MLSRILLKQPLILYIILICGLFAIWLLFLRSSRSRDIREPISIRPKIPVIGHAISLLLYGSDYYGKIRTRTSLPIYTIKLFGHNIYIVNSVELVSGVDRNAQDFSFAPYLVQFAVRALHPTVDATRKLSENLDGGNSDPGLRIQTQKAMRESMASGTSTLGIMNCELLRQLSDLMDMQVSAIDGPVGLFHWVRDTVTIASTNTVYGVANPFLRKEVADGLWVFEKDLALIALDWFPKFIAPKGYHGREAVVKAFVDYFERHLYKEGSPLVKARYKANMMYNVSLEDLARFESSLAVALLVNTAPAAFWTLFLVLSSPTLSMDLRQQLESFIRPIPSDDHTQSSKGSHQTLHINMAQVLRGCPLLKSLMEEVLRVRSANASGRMVMRDTMLNDQYLLRANSTVLIPSASVHNDASVWGATVQQFDPFRFVKNGKSQTLLQPAYAYRAFGGGAALCPGRFLASMEILSMLTIIMLRFDVTPVDSKGHATHWQELKSRSHILTSILSPAKDVRVLIKEREKYRGMTWRFTLQDEEAF